FRRGDRIDVKGLRVELAREAHDLLLGHLDAAVHRLGPDREVLPVAQLRSCLAHPATLPCRTRATPHHASSGPVPVSDTHTRAVRLPRDSVTADGAAEGRESRAGEGSSEPRACRGRADAAA